MHSESLRTNEHSSLKSVSTVNTPKLTNKKLPQLRQHTGYISRVYACSWFSRIKHVPRTFITAIGT